jgi:hydroxymethylbilane synthase
MTLSTPLTLRVGARGSDLSLAQTRWLIGKLLGANPGTKAELIVIETHGDRDQNSSLVNLWPPGGFVKDIERVLIAGEIDLAVHSLKDVPTDAVAGLQIAAIPVRAPAHDVLLTREPRSLDTLPDGFRIGSSSPRRTHQMQRRCPQVRLEPIRGNVPTRIRKLATGEFDGVLLAAAGLQRLGISHPHTIALDPVLFPPAPGQGALAVQTRDTGPVRTLVASIDDPATRAAVTAERAFLKGCGGGCHAAAGAYARMDGTILVVIGQFFRDDQVFSHTLSGPPAEAERLGRALADRLMGTPATRP